MSVRTALTAAALAAALLPAGGASPIDPPCVVANNVYELAFDAPSGLCDLGHDAQYNAFHGTWSLACESVNGGVDSGTATCRVAGVWEQFDLLGISEPLGDTAALRYEATAPGSLASSQGWFRVDVPSIWGLWFTGEYVRTGSAWVLQGTWVSGQPGHVLRTYAMAGTGQGLPSAPGYALALAGAVTFP